MNEQDITKEGCPVAHLSIFCEHRETLSTSISDLPQVDKATFSEEDDMTTGRHRVTVHLRFDVHSSLCISFEPRNVDFNVKVANAILILAILPTQTAWNYELADDSILRHHRKVLRSDNVTVSGSSHKNVGAGSSILHGGDFITSHGSLQGIDGVDFSNQYASTIRPKRLGTLQQQSASIASSLHLEDLHPCQHHRSPRRQRLCQQA